MKAKPECRRRTRRLKLRRSMYLPVRVSTLIFSPVLMKRGLHGDAGFQKNRLLDVLEESPRMPSGASETVSTTLEATRPNSFVRDERDRDGAILTQVIFDVAQDFRREGLVS